MSSPTVLVVGAGVLGAATAWHLARAGAAVTALDAVAPGAGTTPAGAGFVIPSAADLSRDLGPSAVAFSRYSRDLYRDLGRRHDLAWSDRPNLVLSTTPEHLARSTAAILDHPGVDAATRAVTPADVAVLTRGAVDVSRIAGGVLMPDSGQTTTALVVAALLAEAVDAGARVVAPAAVTRLDIDAGRIRGVESTAGTFEAEHVVVAAGAWSNRLLATADWRLPLAPTIVTRFVTAPLGLPDDLPMMQSRDLGLWIRELDGAYSWGSIAGYGSLRGAGLTEDGLPWGRPHADDLVAAMRRDQERLALLFPHLAGAEPNDVWQGIPAYTADGRLIAGAVPTVQGLWALGGDNESGVMHGPGMARLVADLVLGLPPLADPAEVAPGRLAPADYPDASAVERAMAERADRVADAFRG